MRELTAKEVRDTTTLSPEQRERLQREGRVARALEAAQRRTLGRFSRTLSEPAAPSGVGRRAGRSGT